MINFIQDIITRFGGRYFGSEQEKKGTILHSRSNEKILR
jgi:hypothetical protein